MPNQMGETGGLTGPNAFGILIESSDTPESLIQRARQCIRKGSEQLKIGIPRAFYFHSYPGLWGTLFRLLGHQPVVSPRSSRTLLDLASSRTETENCLPQKLFDGHLLFLLDRVDALFVPRVLSIVKGHLCCPRFGALPDATRAGIARDANLLTIEINATREPLAKTLIPFARQLGAGRRAAKQAVAQALAAMAMRQLKEALRQQAPHSSRKFLLLGHPYTLNDRFIADPVVCKLEQLGAPVERMTFEDNEIEPGLIMWCIFNKMHRKLEHLDMHTYAGVIQLSTFNCGADSMMTERFRRMCRHRGVPYMLLMVDEHCGKAGLDTRIEAFVDSLSWQRSEMAR
jgi:predicted nucleotide-binding protein (sugar kinase/HSP70/actin superfamily)